MIQPLQGFYIWTEFQTKALPRVRLAQFEVFPPCNLRIAFLVVGPLNHFSFGRTFGKKSRAMLVDVTGFGSILASG